MYIQAIYVYIISQDFPDISSLQNSLCNIASIRRPTRFSSLTHALSCSHPAVLATLTASKRHTRTTLGMQYNKDVMYWKGSEVVRGFVCLRTELAFPGHFRVRMKRTRIFYLINLTVLYYITKRYYPRQDRVLKNFGTVWSVIYQF